MKLVLESAAVIAFTRPNDVVAKQISLALASRRPRLRGLLSQHGDRQPFCCHV